MIPINTVLRWIEELRLSTIDAGGENIPEGLHQEMILDELRDRVAGYNNNVRL